MEERMAFLEKSFGDSAEKHERHARDIEALRGAHGKLSNDAKAIDAHHASVGERLDYIEKLVGDSADKHEKHAKDYQLFKASHQKLANDTKEQLKSHHAS